MPLTTCEDTAVVQRRRADGRFIKPTARSVICSAICWFLASGGLVSGVRAQSESEVPTPVIPSFQEYDPPSTLVVPEHPVPRARFPFVDVHNHQWNMPEQDLTELVADMDELNMAVMVNLSGRGFRRVTDAEGNTRFALGEDDFIDRALDNVSENAPSRFLIFTNIDWNGAGGEGWSERAVAQLRRDVEAGAVGLKVYKGLGFDALDADGKRLAVDDRRLDPVWKTCAELSIPVLIHTAEPAAFWLPKDGSNERLYEMIEKPERWRGGDQRFISWEQMISEQHQLFRNHPDTLFINAHLGWLGNDLARLGRLLDEMPNVYTEIGAVLAELGRQPRFAKAWFERYKDRVLFGKDSWRPEEYGYYFRTLETADDYFPYYRRRHAFWRLYGLDLSDDVLRHLYYKNALRLFPTIDRSLFPADP